jgi:hypothetical protein
VENRVDDEPAALERRDPDAAATAAAERRRQVTRVGGLAVCGRDCRQHCQR